jgi:glucokinase
MRSVLAVDIGGTKIAAAAMNDDGKLVARRQMETPRDPPSAVGAIVDLVRAAADEAGVVVGKEPLACGVACPGPLDVDAGRILSPPNLHEWHGFALGPALAEALAMPVHVDNDASAAAIAEMEYGGHGIASFVYVTISTGIGAGVFVKGRRLPGALELGHVSVSMNGWDCACGGKGCIEAFASGPAVLKRARAAGLVGGDASPADVLALVERRDRAAVALWDETIDVLAAGFATALHAYDPLAIVVGGGFGLAAWKLMHQSLERRMRARNAPLSRALADQSQARRRREPHRRRLHRDARGHRALVTPAW